MIVRLYSAFKSCVELIRQAIGRPPFRNPFKKYIVPVRVENMMLAQRTGTLRKWYVQKLLLGTLLRYFSYVVLFVRVTLWITRGRC
jgi:hypothetical protein